MNTQKIIYGYHLQDGMLIREPFLVENEVPIKLGVRQLYIHSMINPKMQIIVPSSFIDSGEIHNSPAGYYYYESELRNNPHDIQNIKNIFYQYFSDAIQESQKYEEELKVQLSNREAITASFQWMRDSINFCSFKDIQEETNNESDFERD